jgi:hypothetical protein
MDYPTVYSQIIERAKTRTLEGYTEIHHIIPKCLGGNNSKDNLVSLTAKEHFLCHMLLCEIYPNNRKLWYALFLMSTNKNKKYQYQRYTISSRTYERIKLEWVSKVKGKSKPKGFGDKIKSKERNKKIGLANSKPKPDGFGKKHSILMTGKPKPEGFGDIVSKNKSKKVLQYDKKGNFIKEWDSCKEAGKILNINIVLIGKVALQKPENKSAGGFVWRYKN